jgi:hypothetical protein
MQKMKYPISARLMRQTDRRRKFFSDSTVA